MGSPVEAPFVDAKQDTPASFANFEDEPPAGWLKTVLQFFAIPLLIVVVAVGLYLGISAMVGPGPKTAAEFVRVLQSDTINRRWQAAYELAARLAGEEVPAEFRDPRLVAALCKTLDDARAEREDPPRLAILVLRILRRLEDPEAVGAVRRALDDDHGWVRAHAVLVLAALDDHESRPRIAVLARHADPGTRQASLEALARLDQIEGRPFRLSLETRGLALEHLGDAKEDVRFTAALILADAGEGEAALPVLRRMLDRSYLEQFGFDDRWGGLSAYAVRSRTILKAIGAVVALGSRDEAVLQALGRLASTEFEGDPEVREAARQARRKLETKQ